MTWLTRYTKLTASNEIWRGSFTTGWLIVLFIANYLAGSNQFTRHYYSAGRSTWSDKYYSEIAGKCLILLHHFEFKKLELESMIAMLEKRGFYNYSCKRIVVTKLENWILTPFDAYIRADICRWKWSGWGLSEKSIFYVNKELRMLWYQLKPGPIHDHTVICGIWSGHRKDLIGMSAEVANTSKT